MLYKLGPKKRFINFNDELVNNTLDESFKFLSTNSFSRAELSESTGDIRNIHYGDIHTKLPTICNVFEESLPYLDSNISEKNLNKLVYLCDGDIVIADASEDYKDIGKSVEVFGTNKVKCVAGLHTILARPIKPFAKGFWGQLLQTYNVRLQIMKYATGVSVLGISKSNIGKVIVRIPKRQEEQKKIADFLFAVDKKISQLKKKNALLHQYKKGVMQQLFCQKIRFKDDNGNAYPEWTMQSIGKFIEEYKERVDAFTELPILTSSRVGLFRQSKYYANRELSNEGEYGVLPRGYFTYRHMSDDLVFKFNVNNLCDRGAISKEYPVFRAIGMNSYFLEISLNEGAEFKRFAIQQKQGGTRTRLYLSNLKQFKFPIPSLEEQNKISDFIGSLDKKIKGIARQIEQTQQFKKGLLQQMFV